MLSSIKICLFFHLHNCSQFFLLQCLLALKAIAVESTYLSYLNEFSWLLQYIDHLITPKACAGLNGMKLGGQVLTVVQALPDASSLVHIPPLISLYYF